jgi:GNAT superfamily N-acetyltransferase
MRQYTLEPAAPSDVHMIGSFIERVIMDCVDASPTQKAAFVANTAKNLAKWAEEPDGSLHVVVRANRTFAGVVLVRDFWNLCHLFVAPEHQGHGLGRKLVDVALRGCAGRSPRGYVRLNSSRNAVGFYRHIGFSEVLDAPGAYRGIKFEKRV